MKRKIKICGGMLYQKYAKPVKVKHIPKQKYEGEDGASYSYLTKFCYDEDSLEKGHKKINPNLNYKDLINEDQVVNKKDAEHFIHHDTTKLSRSEIQELREKILANSFEKKYPFVKFEKCSGKECDELVNDGRVKIETNFHIFYNDTFEKYVIPVAGENVYLYGYYLDNSIGNGC